MDLRRDHLLRQLATQTARPLSAQDLAATMVLLHLQARHGVHWLSGPRDRTAGGGQGEILQTLASLEIEVSPRRREQLASLHSFVDLWRSHFFRGVVLDSHEGQLGWMEGRYPLTTRFDIPTAEEMLDLQCEGGRYISLLIQPEQQFLRYGRHADACNFLLHDFEHAHKFYSDPESHRGQVRFFQALRHSFDQYALWRTDLRFTQDLEYLMADMNSHPVHLMKFLKAVVLSAESRRTGNAHPPLDDFWRTLFADWGMTGEVLEASLRLNQPNLETVVEQHQLADFFLKGSRFFFV